MRVRRICMFGRGIRPKRRPRKLARTGDNRTLNDCPCAETALARDATAVAVAIEPISRPLLARGVACPNVPIYSWRDRGWLACAAGVDELHKAIAKAIDIVGLQRGIRTALRFLQPSLISPFGVKIAAFAAVTVCVVEPWLEDGCTVCKA